MRSRSGRSSARQPAAGRQRGFSMIELLVVCAIVLVLAAIATPNFIEAIANISLRNSANSVAGLLQEARLRAVRDNKYYTVRANSTNQAYIDLGGPGAAATDGSGNNAWEPGGSSVTPEPLVQLSGTTQFAQTGAPTFADSLMVGTGSVIQGDSPLRVSFNSRGLPCTMSGSLCKNITSSGNPVAYVYFLTDLRPLNGWAAVSVSPAGRVKVWFYNGSAWK